MSIIKLSSSQRFCNDKSIKTSAIHSNTVMKNCNYYWMLLTTHMDANMQPTINSFCPVFLDKSFSLTSVKILDISSFPAFSDKCIILFYST